MKLVRDKIPQIDTTGAFTYRQAKASELKELFEVKLREAVVEFLDRPCLDKYVDMADIFAQVALFYNLIGTKQHIEHVMAYTAAKAEAQGQFTKFWVQEPALSPEEMLDLADPMHLVPRPPVLTLTNQSDSDGFIVDYNPIVPIPEPTRGLGASDGLPGGERPTWTHGNVQPKIIEENDGQRNEGDGATECAPSSGAEQSGGQA